MSVEGEARVIKDVRVRILHKGNLFAQHKGRYTFVESLQDFQLRTSWYGEVMGKNTVLMHGDTLYTIVPKVLVPADVQKPIPVR